jgi:hypothetical protein
MIATKHQSCLPAGASQTQPADIGTGCATGLLWLLLVVLPAVAQAQDYIYTTNNGTMTITGYTGPDGVVEIPNTINGQPVTSIGEWALAGVASLTSIAIPGSVTRIGSWAFTGCANLSSFAIPGGVTGLEDHASSNVPAWPASRPPAR